MIEIFRCVAFCRQFAAVIWIPDPRGRFPVVDAIKNEFFRRYTLAECRKGEVQPPARHQNEAIHELNVWHASLRREPHGAVLVLPTGAGKTFTAVHFLCKSIIAKGYKVLWLAHTHHLLEQAFATFDRMLSLMPEPRGSLDVRVVSGTPGHSRANTIKRTDDVLLISLQTASNAIKQDLKQFQDFLNVAGDKLFVVFDECHHSPAPSYRNLLLGIRDRHPGVRLLGLTATPTYTQE
ncbi:MAG: DEAD/DEAH box helicase family protein, partial [Gemmataceae bacterium]